jgi:hypothetical protein
MVATLNSRSAAVLVDPATLTVVGPLTGTPLTFPFGSASATKALKEPRRILVSGNTLLVQNFKGGNAQLPATYDFDLLTVTLGTAQQTDDAILGTTNAGMALGSDGKLYAVGTLARNEVIGEAALVALPTGFAESRLWVVDQPGSGNLTTTRDLNRDETGAAVSPAQALTHPTDVVLLESDGTVQKVIVSCFHSDTVGILRASGPDPASWPISARLEIQPLQNGSYSMSGPRGLALKTANPSQANDPGTRVYCLNRGDNSVSVIDPVNEVELTAERFALRNDPTPVAIRQGRVFLYNAKQHGNGFNSCASCHVDGRSDSLGWQLEDGVGQGPPIPFVLQESLDTFWPADKEVMVTQTLQGLVNHPVNLQSQYLFTNEPYHWRADRANLAAFNPAFVNLLGAASQLDSTQMTQFVTFINTIMYPPNPDQPFDRAYAGSFGTDPDDFSDGSGAQRGMKVYHMAQTVGNRGCVHCHALPEGSNNRITENIGFVTGLLPQPVETAQLRGLIQRFGTIDQPGVPSTARTSAFGLLHTGLFESAELEAISLTRFMQIFFSGAPSFSDLNDFMHQLDWGVAPLAGGAYTVDLPLVNAGSTQVAFDLLEGQARAANTGLAVHAFVGTAHRGFWFDAAIGLYREIGADALLQRQDLLALLTGQDDRLVLQGTPAGSERRIAAPTGSAPPLTGLAPTRLELLPMRPASQWRDVPSMTTNWNNPSIGTLSQKTIRIYQHALVNKAPQFGLTQLRHEAPRRLRIAGRNIRHGAQMILVIAADPSTPPPYVPGQPVQLLITGLFSTDEQTGDGRTIWETTLEAEPLVLYALLLGGPFAPDVVAAFNGQIAEPPPPTAFDPLAWNKYQVFVVNEDGKLGVSSTWQPLTIE